MLPNVAVASVSPSRAPEHVDAAMLGGRGRTAVLSSASTTLGGRARSLVRSVAAELDRAISAAIDATEAHGKVEAKLASVGRDATELAILIACATEQRQMVIAATRGVHAYRFRENALVEVTSPSDAGGVRALTDDVLPGDAYVLCTEHVTTTVPPPAMLDALRADYHPREVAWAIVDAARAAAPGADITCIVTRPVDRRAIERPEPGVAAKPLDEHRLQSYRQRLEALLDELRGMRERAEAANPAGFSVSRFATRIGEVEEALSRLRRGVFGRCIRCGTDIQEARIDARPDELRCGNCS